MFASRIDRSIGTGACGSTYAMFNAYALRVIMLAPNASPVVKRQRTWHIGPTTWVFTSRRTANRDSSGMSELVRNSRIAGNCSDTQRASARASPLDLQTKQDA